MLANLAETPLFGGRFRATQLIKAGQGIETFLGEDTTANARVVIKSASQIAVTRGARQRLEHEATILRELKSPYLTPLIHLGHQEQRLFMVMPFIDGVTLEARLAKGPLSVDEALSVMLCILTGLSVAHDHGVLHRDVKPANIVVEPTTPVKRATLIDFGLARSGRLDVSIRSQPVGTVRYMSPEQAGLIDQDVGVRSDLYSAGIVLYEILAGHPPFRAESIGELLRQHLSEKPAELRSASFDVPRALDEVVQRLLRKDPRDRYQSTEAVVADLTALRDARSRGVADPAIVIGLHDRRGSLTEPAFIARTDELARLTESVAAAAQGRGGLVHIEGESGAGKSRVLDELAQRATQAGAWVLRGQAVAYSVQRPFQVLEGFVNELCTTIENDPSLAERLNVRLAHHAHAAAAALPALAAPLGLKLSSQGQDAHGEARTLAALCALIDALGGPGKPVVLVLDDLQWADELTVRLLGHWRKYADERPCHALAIAAFRSEEISVDHPLRHQQPRVGITLSPFGASDVRHLVESMAGPLPEEVVEVVARLSEGSPFMAAAVLQGLVETSAIVPNGDGWKVDPNALSDARSSRRAATILSRRLDLLPEHTLVLLSVGAVLGKEFDLDAAMSLADQTSAESLSALAEARRRHIVWVDASETVCTFIHDKLREALLERLPEAARRALHRAAAERIERFDATQAFELAHHFDAAGEPLRAFPFALEAARRARARFALEIAERQYRIAERAVASDSVEAGQACDVLEELGDVLMLRGQYDEAAQKYGAVRSTATSTDMKVRIESKFGELEFKRGDVAKASEALETGMSLLGHPVPTTNAGIVFAFTWQIVVQVLHAVFPRLFTEKAEASESDRLRIKLCSRLAYAYYFRSTLRASWAHLCEMNLAERTGSKRDLGQAYSNHAAMMAAIGLHRRAFDYAERGLRIRQTLDDVWGVGQSLGFMAMALYHGSRYEEALSRAREAIRMLERSGDRWEAHLGMYIQGLTLGRLGRMSESLETARRLYESAEEIRDLQAAGISLVIWAKASEGAVPEQFIEDAMKRVGVDQQSTANLLHADGIRLYYEGRLPEAAERFERAVSIALSCQLSNEFIAPIPAWLTTVRRAQVEACDAWAPAERQRSLKEALRAARFARWVTFLFGNNVPHVERELGMLHAIAGNARRARRHLTKSLRAAEKQGAERERADSQAALDRMTGARDGSAPLLAGGRRSMLPGPRRRRSSLPARASLPPRISEAPSLSLADRFATVLDSGHRIASALTEDAVYAAVVESAQQLLRGEQCVVLLVAEDGSAAPIAGALQIDFSHSVVERAVRTKQPVLVTEGPSDDSSESLLFTGVRSILCVPFAVPDRTVGCIYATHGQIGRLFGEEEIALGKFIAVLASAALENAEGFARVEALSKSLELRVLERTAELEGAMQELRRSQDALLHMAITDELTGLYSRRFFIESFQKQIKLFGRSPGALSCLMIDVDRFKSVNDTYGHATGDIVLKQVANVLRGALRSSDVLARFGGEEFVVLLPGTDRAGALRAAEKLRGEVERGVIDPVKATVSIGVATRSCETPLRPEQLDDIMKTMLDTADRALYEAKHTGRNRVV